MSLDFFIIVSQKKERIYMFCYYIIIYIYILYIIINKHTTRIPHDESDAVAKAAYVGKNPTSGPDGGVLDADRRKKGGRAFANREKFATCEFRGDWKWHKELWGFKRHYTCCNLCFLCDATTKPGPSQ